MFVFHINKTVLVVYKTDKCYLYVYKCVSRKGF